MNVGSGGCGLELSGLERLVTALDRYLVGGPSSPPPVEARADGAAAINLARWALSRVLAAVRWSCSMG
jgi:hypothetical protein